MTISCYSINSRTHRAESFTAWLHTAECREYTKDLSQSLWQFSNLFIHTTIILVIFHPSLYTCNNYIFNHYTFYIRFQVDIEYLVFFSNFGITYLLEFLTMITKRTLLGLLVGVTIRLILSPLTVYQSVGIKWTVYWRKSSCTIVVESVETKWNINFLLTATVCTILMHNNTL